MNLALKYRPTELEDVVGQKVISVILGALLAKGALHHALLFSGPSGVGKTSMARIIAAKLNPGEESDVHAGTHPSVLEIDAASNGSVEAIRNLKKLVSYQNPGHRVVIVDEAHSMSDEAFDVFLNMLEFPADNVTYILCTTEIQRLSKAIRHRCDWYQFKIATPASLIERLSYVNSEEGLEVSEDLINLIALRSEGSYREALMVLGQISAAGVKTVEDFNELVGVFDYGPGLIRSATYGPSAALSQLETVLYHTNSEEVIDRTIETLRDLMILRGGNNLSYTGMALDIRKTLASQLDSAKILKAMQVLWDLQTKMTNADSVRNLELAFTMIGSALQIVEEKPVVVETKPMSLEAMRAYGKS